MRGIATHTQTLYAQSSVATGLKGATKAMATMNKTEMMSETIDEVLDDDEAEEETEDLTNQVLDEIGVDVASQLSSAPKQKIAGKKEDVSSSSSRINELEERLAALRNP
ncbi:Vacuolar protein sorting-associated protein 2 homolog 3 [Linum perenne]